LGEIVKSIEVNAPAKKVFSYVVDPWNAPHYISSITRVISGPRGTPTKGQAWRAEADLLGKTHEVDLRLDDTVADRAVRFVLDGDPPAVLVLQTKPDGTREKTEVVLTLEVKSVPTIFLTALLGSMLDDDLARLKKNLE